MRCLLIALPAFFGAATAGAADSPYLFVIPAERVIAESGPLDDAIEATLHVSDAGRAIDIIASGGALDVVRAGDREVTVAFDGKRTLVGHPDADDRAESFVIDFGEPAVAGLLAELRQEHGARPTPAELTEFVFAYIDDKTYLASFDLASKVAATRSGDCTEHAVLLTALARATGHAARVAVGVVLIESEDHVEAFGHAWTEIHDGSDWQIADATKPETEDRVLNVRYLPFINLDDEGPGFGLDLARIAAIQPARLSRIGNASGAHVRR